VKIRRTTRDLIVIGFIALACGALSASPLFDIAHGLSLDILTALRWQVFGRRADPIASSAAVVVAFDEESFQTPPLEGSPFLTWTGEVGRVLTAVLDGGAKAAGFDVVFQTSIEQSKIPFGEGVFGDKVRGFDRDFLRALCLAESELCSEFGGQLPGLHRVTAHQRFRSATCGAFAHGGSSRDRYGGHGDGQLQPSDQAVFGYDFFRSYLSKPALGYPNHDQ